MTDDMQRARELLAMCLDDWGCPTEASNVRAGEDQEIYECEFRLIQQLRVWGLLKYPQEATALRAAPEGYVLVPVVATDAMKLAAWKVWETAGDKQHQAWAAMLAARPSVVDGLDRLDDGATVSVPADDSKVVAVPAFRADEALTEIVQQRLNHGRNELTVAVNADVHGEKLHRVSGENLNADSLRGVKDAD